MPRLLTPGSLGRQAALYHQLASLTRSGIGLIEAYEMAVRNPPSRLHVPRLRQAVKLMRSGSTYVEALSMSDPSLDEFEKALLQAGEESGRLDLCFTKLATYYDQMARMIKTLISNLTYPFLVIHLMVFIFPITDLSALVLKGAVFEFIWNKTILLGPAYLIFFLLAISLQKGRSEGWRRFVENVVKRIPVLGPALRELSIARLALALESLLSAGVSFFKCWRLAGEASGAPSIKIKIKSWVPLWESGGVTPSETLTTDRFFPDMFVNLYASGEASGSLDSALIRLHNHYSEEAERKLILFAQMTPRILFILVLIVGGYHVIAFYRNYFDQIQNLGGF